MSHPTNSTLDNILSHRMNKLNLAQAYSTRYSPFPTWGQLKRLTSEADRMVTNSGKAKTPELVFLAMLALLTSQVMPIQTLEAHSDSEKAYWTYFPNPPLLHPSSWSRSNIKIFTSHPELMGGLSDSFIPHKLTDTVYFHGLTEETPLCFSSDNVHLPLGCLPLSYRTYLTDSPKFDSVKRYVWTLEMISIGYNNYNETYVNESLPEIFKKCEPKNQHPDIHWNTMDINTDFPKWITCGFSQTAMVFNPRGSQTIIKDFSVSSRWHDYKPYILEENQKANGKFTLSGSKELGFGEPLHRWFTPGWVTPIFQSILKHGKHSYFSDLYRLLAATDVVKLNRPETTKIKSYNIRACINAPHAILMGSIQNVNVTKNDNAYNIQCKDCVLTNCINSTLNKDLKVFFIVHQPPYVILPVTLKETWYDDPGTELLKKLNELMRPKRFVAALILGITALISIITVLAVSTTALVQEIHTASHVNDLSHNVSVALAAQEQIDKKLEIRINALEETVLFMGNKIQSIQTRMTTRCHANYKWICVTPLEANNTTQWSEVQNHLKGIWNNTNLAPDILALQQKIKDISQAHLSVTPDVNLALDIFGNIKKTITNSTFFNTILQFGLIGFCFLILIFCLPVILRIIVKILKGLRIQQGLFKLQTKKGGIAGALGK